MSALHHPALADLLRRAYSAERAAAIAYRGHAAAVRCSDEKAAIFRIERDEWHHRRQVFKIMRSYGVLPSRYYEITYFALGWVIGASCFIIGWFMPFFFAGKLESGNVCEYFRMMLFFEQLGITKHHSELFEMGVKEKEHEDYFQAKLVGHPLTPVFSRIFGWGPENSQNDVDLNHLRSLADASTYCHSVQS